MRKHTCMRVFALKRENISLSGWIGRSLTSCRCILFIQFRESFFILPVIVARIFCFNLCVYVYTHSYQLRGGWERGLTGICCCRCWYCAHCCCFFMYTAADKWEQQNKSSSRNNNSHNNNYVSYCSHKRSNNANNSNKYNNRNNLSPRAIVAAMSHSPISRSCSYTKERHHECLPREFLLPRQGESKICIQLATLL